MSPEEFKQVWQTQPAQHNLIANPDALLLDIARKQKDFAVKIFWRDVREISVGLVLVPVWACLGVRLNLPWTWYLVVPALLWISGFMFVDRICHSRGKVDSNESLRQRVEKSLAQVEHQIWLLRNVLWWSLVPLGIPMFAFLGHVAWQDRNDNIASLIVLAVVLAIVAACFALVYRVNHHAVRTDLEPRRQELQTLLASLGDDIPAV